MSNFLKQKAKSKSQRYSVGIDIGTSCVKIVKLKSQNGDAELSDYKIKQIPDGLAFFIKDNLKPEETENLIFSVAGPSTIVRCVNFPKMSQAELAGAMRFEAQNYLPFSLEEVELDSVILKDDLPDNKMLVLLAAIKRDFLNDRLKVITDAGLKANIVDIDSLALINAFNYNYRQEIKSGVVALIDIGASRTNFNILSGGLPSLSRDIQVAGDNFTKKFADVLGLDLKQAEELKLSQNKDDLDKVSQAIESVASNLISEIRASVDYYEYSASHGASSIEKIYLNGGGGMLYGLTGALSKIFGVSVESWDPLKEIKIAENLDTAKAKQSAGQLAVGIGLALRGI